MSRTKRDARGWFAYPRKDSGSGWVVRFLDRRGEKPRWRDHRVPVGANVRTQRQADEYGETFYRDFNSENAHLLSEEARKIARAAIPTLQSLSTKWMAAREANLRLAPSTTKADRIHLERHILPAMGEVPLTDADFNTATVRAFVRRMEATERANASQKVAPRTVRNVMNTLRTMIDDCMADLWITGLTTNWVRHPSVRKAMPPAVGLHGRVILRFTREEVERLLVCPTIPELRRLRYLVAVTAGLRDGEVAGLTFGDLDLGERPSMRIEKARRLVRRAEEQTGEPKTRDGFRTLPIHSIAAKGLKAWKASGWAKLVGRSPTPSDPVFPNRRGAFTRTRAADHLRLDLVTAGCSPDAAGLRRNFHTLRKTFATMLAMAGVEEGIRKRLMGHRAADVTDAHYTDKTDEMMRGAVEKIRLDLSSAKVIQLPLRAVGEGGDRG